MIESITMQGAASFSSTTPISIDIKKKVVFLYGHNGTGKSTVARYLQSTTDLKYQTCRYTLPNSQDYQILVYNTDFIEKNFSQDSFEGVFTLGETNVIAEQAIENAEEKIQQLESQRTETQNNKKEHEQRKTAQIKSIKDHVFKVKKSYERGDLEYCLTGFKGSSDKLYEKVITTPLVTTPPYTFDSLLQEATALNDKTAVKKDVIPSITLNVGSIESNNIFQEIIVSSGDSYLAELVTKLQNSIWVEKGLIYIQDSENQCPFCQQDIDSNIVKNINALFDSTYRDKKQNLTQLSSQYQREITAINDVFTSSYADITTTEFELAKEKLLHTLQDNLANIQRKISDPSKKIELVDSSALVQAVNLIIAELNTDIIAFNAKLDSRKESLATINKRFWSLVRIQFESDIQSHKTLVGGIDADIKSVTDKEVGLTQEMTVQNNIIIENRKKITNIDTSITNINRQMKTIGLEGFEIKQQPTNANHYYLCRGSVASGNGVYKSLSEGEKTLITYLYFLELCQGSTDSNSSVTANKKIIVVDDPISSLSHNYIYEIGALTHKKLIKGYNYAQLIVLTHSLYFLHEMIKYLPSNKDDFEKKCNLFRVTKNTTSNIIPMQKSDIQNDYQSYWQVVKDAKEGNVNKVVLPNMMRNILEYYFSFIHKTDALNKALEDLEESDIEFKPFYRFINRESHSDSVNINDLGEIDSTRFIDKFKDVFVRTKFEEHYEKMMA